MQLKSTKEPKKMLEEISNEELTIYKVMNISSAHQLKLPYESKCNKFHGHNWKVEAWITGTLNENGMVMDFNHVKKIVMKLDHEFINDFLIPSTAEVIALYLVKRLFKKAENNVTKIRVRVWETHTSFAEYEETRQE